MASARLRDIASGRRDALNIDPKLILIEKGFNPRQYDLFDNRQHLDLLKSSIRQIGVKVPLLVRWDGEQPILIDGECRLRACLELIKEGEPIKTIPVLQESIGDPAERLLLAVSANTGKTLTVIEAGGAFKRLQAFGWSVDDIATKTGYMKLFVTDALELSGATPEVKEMVSNGSVTPSLAKQVVRQKGDKAGAALKERVEVAKAAGKKTASREKAPNKLHVSFEECMGLGDQMADVILTDDEFKDTRVAVLARKWNKLRGL